MSSLSTSWGPSSSLSNTAYRLPGRVWWWPLFGWSMSSTTYLPRAKAALHSYTLPQGGEGCHSPIALETCGGRQLDRPEFYRRICFNIPLSRTRDHRVKMHRWCSGHEGVPLAGETFQGPGSKFASDCYGLVGREVPGTIGPHYIPDESGAISALLSMTHSFSPANPGKI